MKQLNINYKELVKSSECYFEYVKNKIKNESKKTLEEVAFTVIQVSEIHLIDRKKITMNEVNGIVIILYFDENFKFKKLEILRKVVSLNLLLFAIDKEEEKIYHKEGYNQPDFEDLEKTLEEIKKYKIQNDLKGF